MFNVEIFWNFYIGVQKNIFFDPILQEIFSNNCGFPPT